MQQNRLRGRTHRGVQVQKPVAQVEQLVAIPLARKAHAFPRLENGLDASHARYGNVQVASTPHTHHSSPRFQIAANAHRRDTALVQDVDHHLSLFVIRCPRANVRHSNEERVTQDDGGDQHSESPNVGCDGVRLHLQQDLWRTIGDGVGREGQATGGGYESGEAEVAQIDVVVVGDEKVVQLDVSVDDVTPMKEVENGDNLVYVQSQDIAGQTTCDTQPTGIRREQSLLNCPHDPSKVVFNEIEYQIEVVRNRAVILANYPSTRKSKTRCRRPQFLSI